MKWIFRIDRAVTVLLFLGRWFRGASADGRLTVPEIVEGVGQLITLAGFEGQIRVDKFDPATDQQSEERHA